VEKQLEERGYSAQVEQKMIPTVALQIDSRPKIDSHQRAPGEQAYSTSYQMALVWQYYLVEQKHYYSGRNWHNVFHLVGAAFHNAGKVEQKHCQKADSMRT
jgi:hypothetical protein